MLGYKANLYLGELGKKKNDKKPFNIVCPVCGYYCLGNGGTDCIDKPFLCGYNLKGKEYKNESI